MPNPSRQRVLAGFDDESPPDSSPTAATDQACQDARHRQLPPSESLDGKTVWVVDAHSLIYQVFHAMPSMTGPKGQPVGAVHGFIRDVLDLLEKKKPDYLICAFDRDGHTVRHEQYAQYKINRPEMPDDLRPQIGDIRRMLAAMQVASLECPRYEADDILATVARQTEKYGGRCFLVTSDKDCRQLISDRVKMYNIRKDLVFDSTALKKDWGIRPDQVVDFQALVGDAVDDIPGVPLIGPKLAGQLLQQFGTLEELFEHVDQVSGKKRRENLSNYRQQALMSRKLVRLIDDVPVAIDWKAARVGGMNRSQVMQLCRELGFRRLGDRMAELGGEDGPAQWHAEYRTVVSEEQLRRVVDAMAGQSQLAVCTISTAASPRWGQIVGYALSWQAGQAWYLPVRAPQGEPCLPEQRVLASLRPILEDASIGKLGHDLKRDVVRLRAAGIQLRGAACDTMVADYLLAPGERQHDLSDLAKRYLNYAPRDVRDLTGSGKSSKPWDAISVEQLTDFAGEQVDLPLRLASVLQQQLEEERLSDLYSGLEMPLMEVLAELEFHGICVDVQRLAQLSDRFGQRMADLQAEIYALAGSEFNIDSRLQLSKVLFEDLQLPVVKKTKTGPSTDVDVLTQLAEYHPLPAKIIAYRQAAKLKSTYVDALPELVCPQTGRVHTSFKQDVAATGRLSSQDPNLQNIPVRTQEGREIRSAFLPGQPGWQLMTADYSQIELRVLAHFSGDAALRRAFAADQDIHTLVASEVYGVPLDQVQPEMRRSAKTINFGVIYGQTPFGLAKSLGIEKAEAARFIDAYFARYVGVDRFIAKILEECRQTGYVSTISGRRRAVEGVRDSSRRGDSRHRNLPERIAVNTVIQGSAADLIKQAMIQVHCRLQREKLQARMLLQIHDELVFEAPAEETSHLATLVSEEMSSVGQLAVPLKVDVKSGKTWADCEPLA